MGRFKGCHEISKWGLSVPVPFPSPLSILFSGGQGSEQHRSLAACLMTGVAQQQVVCASREHALYAFETLAAELDSSTPRPGPPSFENHTWCARARAAARPAGGRCAAGRWPLEPGPAAHSLGTLCVPAPLPPAALCL